MFQMTYYQSTFVSRPLPAKYGFDKYVLPVRSGFTGTTPPKSVNFAYS